MIKKLLIPVLLLICASSAVAESPETIVLKDGNRFEGYMKTRFPDGTVYVHADVSEVTLSDELVEMIEEGEKTSNIHIYEDAVGSEASIFTDDPEGLIISNVEILDSNEGTRFRFKSRPVEFETSMSEIKEIIRPTRPANQVNGLYDIIYTRDGKTYTGEIIKIVPGEFTRIKENNKSINVPTGDIARMSRRHVDKRSSVFLQTPLLEDVELVDGSWLFNVLIADQDYVNGTFEVVDSTLNLSGRYRLMDVASFNWKPNPAYAPEVVKKTAPNTITVNGKSYNIIKYTTSKDGKDYTFKFNPLNTYKVKPKNGTVRIEYNAAERGSNIAMIPAPVRGSMGKDRMIDFVVPIGSILSSTVIPAKTYNASGSLPTRVDYSNLEIGRYYIVFFLGTSDCVLLLID